MLNETNFEERLGALEASWAWAGLGSTQDALDDWFGSTGHVGRRLDREIRAAWRPRREPGRQGSRNRRR